MRANNVILFVDDEEHVLSSIKRALRDVEFRCIFAASGDEALRIMEKENISVIVSDMRMPGMNGLTLLKHTKELYPNTVRIVLSGYTQLQQVIATVNQADIFRYITKPWQIEEFLPALEKALDYYNMIIETKELKKSLEARNEAYQRMLQLVNSKSDTDRKTYEDICRVYLHLTEYIYRECRSNKIGEDFYRRIIKLFLSYMSIYPDKKEEYELNSFLYETKEKILKINSNNSVDIQKSEFDNLKIFLSKNKFFFIVQKFLILIMQYEEEYSIKIGITDVNSISNNVSFYISFRTNSIVKKFNYYYENKEYENLVQKLIEILDISSEILEEDNKLICKISGIF